MRSKKTFLISVICLSLALLWPGSGQAQDLKLRVILEKAEIHLRPDTNSSVLGESLLGTILESDMQTGEWFRVVLPADEKGFRLTGFIQSIAVEVITKRPAEKPVEEIPIKEEEPMEEKPVPKEPVKEEAAPSEEAVEEKPSPPPAKKIEPTAPTQLPEPSPVQPPPMLQPARPGIDFSLKFHSGMNYMGLGDINDALQGITDYYKDLPNVDIEEDLIPVHWGIDLGGELIINFTPRVGIGLGGGYIQVNKETVIDLIWEGTPYKDTAHPKATLIPLTLGVYLSFPLGNTMNFTLNAGAGYYFGTIQWNYGWDSEHHDYEENWKAKSHTMGFQGGLGLEFNISRSLALLVEGFGRYAKLKSLQGDYIWKRDFFGHEEGIIEEATLWYYDWRSSDTGKEYPRIDFDDDVPAETSFQRNVREGEVDLAGFSVRLGIKIRF
ncbi:MAG: outer membrane beta-barrel protein [Candidatus Aminicenantes bacterium]|nr:outer membrane beta-barrel protein [Candidatus Aminicenantes bacterium]